MVRKPRVTLKLIAERAGLSSQTVSFIFNGQEHLFRPETVQRVRDTADALGYRPNALARAIQRGSMDAWGLVLSDHPYLSNLPDPLFQALVEAVAPLGVTLHVERWPAPAEGRPALIPRLVRELHTDGIFINDQRELPVEMLDLLGKARAAWVQINHTSARNAVRPDDRGAGRDATRFLIARGHRRIDYADWLHDQRQIDGGDHYSIRDRWLGYVDAMREAGLEPRLRRHHEPMASGEKRPPDLAFLAAEDAPTALVLYSDFGMAHLWRHSGERFMREVEVVTFGQPSDSLDGIRYHIFSIDYRAIAGHLVTMLQRRIADPRTDQVAVAVPFIAPVAGGR